MNSRGRPTLYHPDLTALAREHCRRGASNEALAVLFGVAPRTIDNWMARIPEFATAVNEERAAVRGEMARKLYQRAIGYRQTVERVVRLPGGGTTTVAYTRHHLPETRACIRYLHLRCPQQWRRRPDLPADARQNSVPPAAQEFGAWQPAERDDVEVVNALHQRGMGCRQTVERVVVWFGEPKVITYVRQHPPQYQAGVTWLTNRLPEQWKPLAAFRTTVRAQSASPPAHKLAAGYPARGDELSIAEVGDASLAAAGALNGSDLAKRKRPAGSAADTAGPKAAVGLLVAWRNPHQHSAFPSSRAGSVEAPTAGGSGEIRAQENSKKLPVLPEMPIFRPRMPASRGPPVTCCARSRRAQGWLAGRQPKGRESVFTST